MNISEINEKIKENGTQVEQLFIQLGNIFPALLNREGETSFRKLQGMISNIKETNDASSEQERALNKNYAEKYSQPLTELTNKIDALEKLNLMISEIKEDSEQMELIALNAMVVSIKSGEKGRAFSCITENLKRLSNDMFIFSDQLISEEKELLTSIRKLKAIFNSIFESQKQLSILTCDSSSQINTLISDITAPLEVMQKSIESIYPPIRNGMEGLQLQDIIRQALDQVHICLKQIESNTIKNDNSDADLDTLSFNNALVELAQSIIKDVKVHIVDSRLIFDNNWKTVYALLDTIQNTKENFEATYLDAQNPGPKNIVVYMNTLIHEFQKMIDEFNHYYSVQKDLLHTCQSITEKARAMHTVYENLRPVVSRLHHVRILQQIEVSKNMAIASVTDSAVDMDKLITSATKSLDGMQNLLEGFIVEMGTLLSFFTESIEKDNKEIVVLNTEKNKFFIMLKSKRDDFAGLIHNFSVFPPEFEENCKSVKFSLDTLNSVTADLNTLVNELHNHELELTGRKKIMMEQRHIASWEIQNTQFRNLINHFTLSAHKEAAGKIGGFAIEKGAQAGEIQLF
jgi:hypothetical protein